VKRRTLLTSAALSGTDTAADKRLPWHPGRRVSTLDSPVPDAF